MRWWVDRTGRRCEVLARRIDGGIEVSIDGESSLVQLEPLSEGLAALFCPDGRNWAVASQRLGRGHFRVWLAQRLFEVRLRDPLERDSARDTTRVAGPHEVCAPIPGRVITVAVKEGDSVHAGQTLVVLEAMKMENQICAESPGTVERVLVIAGSTVEGGQPLVVISAFGR